MTDIAEELFGYHTEVKRLEAEIERLTANRDYWQQIAREDRAEVERLRAAHREIVALAAGSQGAYGKFARAQKISGDALKDTTP